MPDEARMQAKRGPLAALLLLVGLVFTSFSAGAVTGIDDASARPAQLRTGKSALAPRAAVRTAADDDDDGDRLDTPVLRPEPPRPTREVVGLHDASGSFRASSAARVSARASPYRSRAPPARA